jgi:hypothetical protein
MMDKGYSKSYWFADKDVDCVVRKFTEFDDPDNIVSPMWGVVARNFFIYFSNVIEPDSWESGLVYRGKQGEIIKVIVPMAKSLTQQIVDTATKQRLSFMCLADSTAMNVIETSRLGTALTKTIIREQKVDLKWAHSLESELVTGMGFLYVKWRSDRGPFFNMQPSEEVDPETGEPVQIPTYKGDVQITVPTFHDVLFDPTIPDPDDWHWVRVREMHNRWDLIAQFPHLREQLLRVPSVRDTMSGGHSQGAMSPTDEDMVYTYAIYHKPTPALKKGRMIVYCDLDSVMVDMDNVYGELPVYCSRGRPIWQSSYGDPLFSQLIAAQEMLDAMVSAVCTNNAAFAVQNIVHPKGSGINVEQILGMNFFGYQAENIPGGGKPEPLQLTKSAPETYQLIDLLEKYMMDLSRMNSALRGNPPTGVTSGTAIATLTATAIEAVEAVTKASRLNLKKAMMGALNCYRRFGSIPRDIEISGIGDQTTTKQFLGRDLDPIRSIELQEINPLMQTQSGRVEIAKDLLANQMIRNVKGYFSILNGAPLEEIYKDELSQEDLVNRENEHMMRGEPVKMINTDDHAYHIMMHSQALNDPKIRMNEDITEPFLAHILEHYEAVKGMDPILIGIILTGKMPDPALLAQSQMAMGGQPQQLPPGEGGGAPTGAPKIEAPIAKPAQPAQDPLQRAG